MNTINANLTLTYAVFLPNKLVNQFHCLVQKQFLKKRQSLRLREQTCAFHIKKINWRLSKSKFLNKLRVVCRTHSSETKLINSKRLNIQEISLRALLGVYLHQQFKVSAYEETLLWSKVNEHRLVGHRLADGGIKLYVIILLLSLFYLWKSVFVYIFKSRGQNISMSL